jgi:hypothetical protein
MKEWKQPYIDHWNTCKLEECATCCRKKGDKGKMPILKKKIKKAQKQRS